MITLSCVAAKAHTAHDCVVGANTSREQKMTNPQDKTQGMGQSQNTSTGSLADKAKAQGQGIQLTQGVNEDSVSFEKRKQEQIDQNNDSQTGVNSTKTGSTSYQPS